MALFASGFGCGIGFTVIAIVVWFNWLDKNTENVSHTDHKDVL